MSFGASFTGVTFFQQPGPPFVPTSADNGLSVDAVTGRIVLGNDQSDPAMPARFLSHRDINTNGFLLFLTFLDNLLILEPESVSVSSNINQSSGYLAKGQMSLSDQLADDARIFLGTHNVAKEVEFLWLGASDKVTLRLRTQPQLGWQFFYQTGNFRIGDDQPDNGTKLQVNGDISMRHVTANLDFPNTAAQTSSDLTINVPDAALGDTVILAPVSGFGDANSCYTAFVSSPGNVTVRFNNYSAGAIDPVPDDFNISLFKQFI